VKLWPVGEMMEKNRGWIKVHRDIRKHWVWQKPEYFQAWMYLLISANHKEKTWLQNGNLVQIKRGELVTSLESLAEQFTWSRGKVRHFLNLLEKDTMIVRVSNHNYTHLSICKYETYQTSAHSDSTTDSTTKSKSKANRKTQLKDVKNDKNDKNDKVLVSKKIKFEKEVMVYKDKYPEDMLKSFISYWSELNQSKTKMRVQMEKTWETGRRLAYWASNDRSMNNGVSTESAFAKIMEDL